MIILPLILLMISILNLLITRSFINLIFVLKTTSISFILLINNIYDEGTSIAFYLLFFIMIFILLNYLFTGREQYEDIDSL